MPVRPIAFLSDFGHRDPFVGICHAVILREDTSIPIIDLTHGVPRQDVQGGAVALADSVPFLPGGAVVVAVVDPGVGGERRAVALDSVSGVTFVGPDNGLLMPAAEACGGVGEAYEISESPWRLEPVSNTFHGRDIFSPVAARLATGAALPDAGEAIDADSLERLDLPTTTVENGEIVTAVLAIDEYGNARLAAQPADLNGLLLGGRVEIDTGEMRRAGVYAETYADAEGEDPLLIADSSGALSIAVQGGSAAEALRLEPGKEVKLIPV